MYIISSEVCVKLFRYSKLMCVLCYHKQAYEFPGWKTPAKYPRFPTGPQVQQYAEKYVEHFKLAPYLRMGTTVTRAERRDGTPVRVRTEIVCACTLEFLAI